MAETTPVPVAESLAGLADTLRGDGFGPATRRAAVAVLVDWFGACLGGSRSAAARALADGLSPVGGGPSRLVGFGRTAEVATAALVNGTAAHALEVDDIFGPGLYHPGAPIIAAALAMADRQRATGRDLLRAVVYGYEVGNRVAMDLGPSHYERWHTTGTAGAVGAAAAAADLLGCDRRQLANAFSLAATMAGGLQQTFRRDAVGKPLHSGHAAQVGVLAAISARGGLTGAADAFEGAAGMGAAMQGAGEWTGCRAPADGSWLIEQTTVKPYPCCGHTFAPIDAALELRAGLDPAQVTAIEVTTYRAAIDVAGNSAPTTPAEARFSIPFTVAAALVDGAVADASFAVAGQLTGPRTALLGRVTLQVGEQFQQVFPERRGATVRITTADGGVRTATASDRSGSPQRPMTPEQIDNKFAGLAGTVLDRAATEEFRHHLDRIDELADLDQLRI